MKPAPLLPPAPRAVRKTLARKHPAGLIQGCKKCLQRGPTVILVRTQDAIKVLPAVEGDPRELAAVVIQKARRPADSLAGGNIDPGRVAIRTAEFMIGYPIWHAATPRLSPTIRAELPEKPATTGFGTKKLHRKSDTLCIRTAAQPWRLETLKLKPCDQRSQLWPGNVTKRP